jgi:hypothetical protein
MAVSHADFFRIIPAVLHGERYEIKNGVVSVERDDGHIDIHVSPEGSQQIASLRLPRTRVELHFLDCTSDAVEAFLRNFDLRFRRGGG